MAQDPEHDEEPILSEDTLDVSHDLDMVPVFSSTGVDAEVEGDLICGVLANTGIPAVQSGSLFPNLGISVCVPRESLHPSAAPLSILRYP